MCVARRRTNFRRKIAFASALRTYRSSALSSSICVFDMPGPLLLIPAVIVAALIAFIKIHAVHITFRAAMAAAVEFCRSRDADKAVEAAVKAGANAAAGDLVGDFFRARFRS
jgi:hypothetical protein